MQAVFDFIFGVGWLAAGLYCSYLLSEMIGTGRDGMRRYFMVSFFLWPLFLIIAIKHKLFGRKYMVTHD